MDNFDYCPACQVAAVRVVDPAAQAAQEESGKNVGGQSSTKWKCPDCGRPMDTFNYCPACQVAAVRVVDPAAQAAQEEKKAGGLSSPKEHLIDDTGSSGDEPRYKMREPPRAIDRYHNRGRKDMSEEEE
jgi:hypothetical protein